MCGLAGVALRDQKIVTKKTFEQLSSALQHRGPDGEGRFTAKGVGLLHRRLSIIDLTGGAQPLANANETLQLIGVGEIYNYQTLRDELAGQGIKHQSGSDFAPLLGLYQQCGVDFIHQLEGMYALALWDAGAETLYLARDHAGIKPLYYAETEQGIMFASEPQAIVATDWLPRAVNEAALPAFLNQQYVGGRETLWQGIKRVMPGELLIIKRGQIIGRRWRQSVLAETQPTDLATALAQWDGLWEETVRAHLQSDVPYGAFLSGGIDSSSVVSAMAPISPQPVRTYSVGFTDHSVPDEVPQADRVAQTIGSQQTNVLFSEQDFWDYLPTMVTALDDPVADYAALPLLKLAARASDDVKVILTGEGGDEVFAGYSRYRRGWWSALRGRVFRGRGAVSAAQHWVKQPIAQKFVNPFCRPEWDQLQHYQAADIADWLPDNLLTKTDRCLMHYGIEGRVPLLDRAVMKFGFALPKELKLRQKVGKFLLKYWLDLKLPEADVWAKKRGFTVPITAWLNQQRPALASYLGGISALNEYFDIPAIQGDLAQPPNKKQAKLLFNILIFAGWYERHILNTLPYTGLQLKSDVSSSP